MRKVVGVVFVALIAGCAGTPSHRAETHRNTAASQRAAVERAIAIMRKRVDQLGVAEPEIVFVPETHQLREVCSGPQRELSSIVRHGRLVSKAIRDLEQNERAVLQLRRELNRLRTLSNGAELSALEGFVHAELACSAQPARTRGATQVHTAHTENPETEGNEIEGGFTISTKHTEASLQQTR